MYCVGFFLFERMLNLIQRINRNNWGIGSNNDFQKREFYTHRGVILVTKRIKITRGFSNFVMDPKGNQTCVYTIASEVPEKKTNQIHCTIANGFSSYGFDSGLCVGGDGYKSQLDEVVFVTH